MSFVYPQNRELMMIGPDKVARITQKRVGFDILPLRPVNAHYVEWEQKDNYKGLQQLRGLDGSPSLVKRVGSSRYIYEPGVFGEFVKIDEAELTKRAGPLTADQLAGIPIDVSDLVLDGQDQLIVRELDRIEQIIWTLLIAGTITVSQANGLLAVVAAFTIQTSSGTDWSNASAGTPIADFRAAALLGAGKGVTFGSQAKAYMSRPTANYMLNNTNANDVGGKRIENGANMLDLRQINAVLAANDLPQIEIYDEGYINDSNVFTRFLTLRKVVIVGARADGSRVGEYRLTRNANNPGMAPGSYERIIDRTGNNPNRQEIPADIQIHRGHNGGPAIYFPSAIIVMSV
jgi:hypothetical protein